MYAAIVPVGGEVELAGVGTRRQARELAAHLDFVAGVLVREQRRVRATDHEPDTA